jgi:DNA-binding transcriptional LysR family regulator
VDLEQLRTFLEIVRVNSFRQAARNRNRSQPAVSAQIQVLEKALNTPLFKRYGNRFSLTQTGTVYVRYAKRILNLHEQALEEMAKACALASHNGRGSEGASVVSGK